MLDTEHPKLGHFQILEPLGRGGFTEVMLARDLRPKNYGGLVAIKRLRPGLIQRDPVFLDSLLFEAELGMLITNPHLIKVDSVFEAEGEPAVVMEYVEGYRVTHLLALAAGSGLLPEAAAELMRQVCEGLAALHRAKDASGTPLHTVHQDIKPDNILVTRGALVKLIDLNMARPQLGDRPPLWIRQGTPGYRSPEQARGEWNLTPSSDLYSVGVVLFELLTGRSLFGREARDAVRLEERQKQLSFQLEQTASKIAPPGLDLILRKLLAYDPQERFATAPEVIQALSEWLCAWNPRFELKEYLVKRQGALEALLSRRSSGVAIHDQDTDVGVRNPVYQADEQVTPLPTGSAVNAVQANPFEPVRSGPGSIRWTPIPPPNPAVQAASSGLPPMPPSGNTQARSLWKALQIFERRGSRL
ncbi:MAG: serine/threonine-protein kinase [Myxococcota bacterium]